MLCFGGIVLMFLFQNADNMIHLLFMERIPEPQNNGKQQKADCGHKRSNIKNTLFHRRIKSGALLIAHQRQQPADQTGGCRLA